MTCSARGICKLHQALSSNVHDPSAYIHQWKADLGAPGLVTAYMDSAQISFIASVLSMSQTLWSLRKDDICLNLGKSWQIHLNAFLSPPRQLLEL